MNFKKIKFMLMFAVVIGSAVVMPRCGNGIGTPIGADASGAKV